LGSKKEIKTKIKKYVIRDMYE